LVASPVNGDAARLAPRRAACVARGPSVGVRAVVVQDEIRRGGPWRGYPGTGPLGKGLPGG
jgi:hypothetical protein